MCTNGENMEDFTSILFFHYEYHFLRGMMRVDRYFSKRDTFDKTGNIKFN